MNYLYYTLAALCFFGFTTGLLMCISDTWAEAALKALYTLLVVALIPLGVFLIYIGQRL